MTNHIGLIGLGTMGANLARNAVRNGATVSVYNRTSEKTDEFMSAYSSEGSFVSSKTLEEFVQSIPTPRAIVLMVKAGPAVDAVVEDLLPHLDKGDILIDAGNSLYKDTDKREQELAAQDIHFIGMGVSGGEEGALQGPSMMPGGKKQAYEHVRELFERMAADDGDGGTCIAHIGDGGAGHFVKMVHNGIEYGIMQILAESYDVLKTIGGLSNEELHEVFTSWADAPDMQSFLLEITRDIFTTKDADSSVDLIDVIADRAGQKGTGKWTTEAAMTYGVAIPSINAAVDARIISGSVDQRSRRQDLPAHIVHTDEPLPAKNKLVSLVRDALELSTVSTYVQGFELMKTASEEEGWNLDLGECARIWRGGCIIRSVLLPELQRVYDNSSITARDQLMQRFRGEKQLNWRSTVSLAISQGLGLPSMTAALSYFDSLRRDRLPQCLIQAQRDNFGRHGFERTDKDGKHHGNWASLEPSH